MVKVYVCGRTHGAPFRGYGYVPLRNGGNVVTRIGTQQQQKYMSTDFINNFSEISNFKKSKNPMGFFSHIAEWEKNPMGKIKFEN